MSTAPSRRTAGSVAAVALSLLVSGCVAPIAGTPVAAPGERAPQGAQVREPADLPYGRYAELADAWATMRTWDLCAVHDPTEAKNMLSGVGGSVVPYLDLSRCKVDVKTNANTFSFELSVTRAENPETKPTRVTVDGTTFNRYTDANLGDCEYQLPFRADAVLSMNVSSVRAGDRPRTCQLGEDYLRAVLPRMRKPPTTGTGASTPQMLLAGQDPCAGPAAVRREIQRDKPDEDLLLSVSNPAECEVDVFSGTSEIDNYGLRFTVGYRTGLDTGDKVEVAGLRGLADELGSTCRTTLELDAPPLVATNQGEEALQMVEVTTPRCDQRDLVERMLAPYADALTATPPEPIEDAVRLGNLNPPSDADQAGAPFDPCTVVSWRDFPRYAQDKYRPEPHLADLNLDNRNVQTGCVFYGEKVVTTLGWGKDNLETLRQRNAVSGRETTVHGRSATVQTTRTNNGEDLCTHFVSTQQGTIAIATSENAMTGSTGLRVCPVNTTLLKVVTDQVP